MNFKVFSIILAFFLIVVGILVGVYYYLFEYSKPNYEYYSDSTQTNFSQTSDSPATQPQNNPPEQEPKNIIQDFQNSSLQASSEQNSSQTQISPIKQNDETLEEQNKTEKTQLPFKQKTEPQIQQTAGQKSKQKNQQNNNTTTSTKSKTAKTAKLSPIKEYQQRGKDSRLEPKLSTETIKVYVVDGKALSDYRINLLKDMLAPVQERSVDYNLSIFIEMLPKQQMNLTIYNKDIIFSEKKKAYKYISIEQIMPYLNAPDELNEKVAREEIIERINLQSEEDNKGSDFAQHIKSLKTGLQTAQYFFPFSEVIQISSTKAKQ